jgi:Tfp pilus assembly protein PilV
MLEEGYTLIEALVAIFILTIALLGLAAGATSVMKANQMSYLNTVATSLAQDTLEQLKASTVSAMPDCPTYTTPNCSDSPSYSGATFSRSWRIIPDSPVAGVNQIDVNVQWTDSTSHSFTISSSVMQ